MKNAHNILSLSGLLGLLLTLSGCGQVEVRTSIEIEAPRERVYATLADFETYPDWNPYHVKVEGDAREGAQLAVKVIRPDGKEINIPPHLLRLKPNEEITWGGGIKGIFYGEHVMRLEELPNQRTRLIHNEDFSGLAIPFADLPPEVLTEGYESMNMALKRHVESL